MGFTKADSKVPSNIGALFLHIAYQQEVPDPTTGEVTLVNRVSYEVEVKDQNGERMRAEGDIGDLIPLLSGTEQSQLLAFLQAQKAKAISGLIG